MREIKREYSDPLDLVWLRTAERMGVRVVRDREVFASWDGEQTLRIGTAETLDPDDSLAQMIFHEICHHLVEGPESIAKPDWGLSDDLEEGKIHEHACLRLQCALADQHGLRCFFAATTDFRSYYDLLGDTPLEDLNDPATGLAVAAFERATTGPWATPLERALVATRKIADTVQEFADQRSLWQTASAKTESEAHSG